MECSSSGFVATLIIFFTQFVGAGERRKAILGPIAVNVYAIGLYVDTTDAKVPSV